MKIRATNIYFIAAATVVALIGSFALTTAGAHAQDFSKSYRYGGGVNIPGAPSGGSDEEVDIVDVSAGIDAGGVLGCSGLDLGGMIQNTLDVGDLAGEFQSYLKNKLATEALSLLYSQPGVSQVLDGLKAVGHARASLLQEKCNANEIMADATNQRLKSEAQELCLEDKGSMVECEGEDQLAPYVNDLSTSDRWSGTLHDHICPEDEDGERSSACKFIPNFAYDVGGKSGEESEAAYNDKEVRNSARASARDCLQTRGERASALVSAKGYSCAQRLLGSGAVKLSCAEGSSFDPSGFSCRPDDGSGPEVGSDPSDSDPAGAGSPDDDNPAAAGLSAAESCVVEKAGENPEDDPTEINTEDLGAAIEEAGSMDIQKIIDGHTECIIGKELHSHVDLNIATAPAVEAAALWNGLSELYATKAFMDLNAMRIRKLSETIVNSGGRDAVNSCPRDDEGKKENPSCKDTPPPQQLEKAASLLQQFRDEQDAAMAELEMNERVSDRIDRMNQEREERIEEGVSSAARAAQRGGRTSQNASQRKFYPDFFQ